MSRSRLRREPLTSNLDVFQREKRPLSLSVSIGHPATSSTFSLMIVFFVLESFRPFELVSSRDARGTNTRASALSHPLPRDNGLLAEKKCPVEKRQQALALFCQTLASAHDHRHPPPPRHPSVRDKIGRARGGGRSGYVFFKVSPKAKVRRLRVGRAS